MVEVLIAVVILAVGLLGVAGLQGLSLRNTYSATLRTQATAVAQDMAERIRSNREFALANAESYRIAATDTAVSGGADCTSSLCSGAELADFDRNQWLQDLATLPTGKGVVSIDGASRIATITVLWDNDRSGATGTDCSSNRQQDLTCFVLTVQP